MNLGRRQFLGAFAAGSATLVLPRQAAETASLSPLTGQRLLAPAIAKSVEQPALLSRALAAMQTHHGRIANRDTIGLVDFSAPSREARFTLVDVAGGRVLSTHLVSHGKGSDPGNRGWVERLSNRPGSEASCSGSFVTGEAYVGKHGRSRRLIGLDPENDLALPRGIVIHAADYVGKEMAVAQGRVGRSQGCFAVSPREIAHVLERLGQGRMLFAGRQTSPA